MSWEADLDTLVTERGSALVAYAYLLAGNLASAEDLVQDAIVRTYSRRRPEDITWVEAYVRRVILHTYLDGYRARRRFAAVTPLLATADVADGAQEAAGDRTDVARALTALSPRERACVVLRFYDDLTLPEIGLRLGVSAGAVKRYLSDARRKLEPLLGPQPGLATEDVATITKGGSR
ncbi:sigma-70 family RNA polymerase sigma factor [Cellulomonas fengjieae]|uniref:sigma-70 family RNA polymerase sigma factor n=1 Tax=Cellulomonas fengjieae TaxID=2819978 RepID=UPI001AAF61C8|nr:sigma-70 family RNA polymerase sigma factor [Cellulomonas fengjieae]MBO3101822.1 sigma-70 family RNA polymerase sigma factor [Cellulomonas fengjieae]